MWRITRNMHDSRYNNYHIIDYNPNKWTKIWINFPGISYIPLVTDMENWLIDNHDFDIIHRIKQDKWHYSVYMSIIYIILILILKQRMNVRGQPYNLRKLLILWNSFLAVFSILGVIRCLPEFYHIWTTKGFTATFCESDYYEDLRLNWWYLLFVWSKVFELIDTLFIVLRKGKTTNLHLIHHILTLCYSWYVFADIPATARWMVNMNFIAHSLMYTYYSLKALRLSIPLFISISITSIQILQMVFGIYINYKVIEFKKFGVLCDNSLSVGILGFLLYIIFFILFMDFFIKTYLIKNQAILEKAQIFNYNIKEKIYINNISAKFREKNEWKINIIK